MTDDDQVIKFRDTTKVFENHPRGVGWSITIEQTQDALHALYEWSTPRNFKRAIEDVYNRHHALRAAAAAGQNGSGSGNGSGGGVKSGGVVGASVSVDNKI